jgi:hypothetical protein
VGILACRGNTTVHICVYIELYINIYARGLTCVHHVVVLQKKNAALRHYAQQGLTGGVLMALQAGANVDDKDGV